MNPTKDYVSFATSNRNLFVVYYKILADRANYDKTGLDESITKLVDEVSEKMAKNAESYAWNYLIRGSLIVAALFHDIGYPIRYTYKGTESVSDYISLVIPSDNVGFDRFNDLLENSLLFKTVSKKELRRQYETLDHGALSAYILLMQFYESGAIRELDPIKKAIIELAAVITFDHTLKYKALGDEEKAGAVIRERPSFRENPLSYTLRFVDDIQEWDRLYFEIEGQSEYFFCEKCKMPIVRAWHKYHMNTELGSRESVGIENPDNFSLGYVVSPMQRTLYVCGCMEDVGEETKDDRKKSYKTSYYAETNEMKRITNDRANFRHFSTECMERGSPFQYRSINYTITCDDVLLIKRSGDSYEGGTTGCTDTFYIDYNPYKELHLLLLNHKALRCRIKEYAKLAGQFKQQSVIRISVGTHITENPMMLKMRVMCGFLYEVGAYIAVGSEFGHNPYRRNQLFHDMLTGLADSSREDAIERLRYLFSRLKKDRFLAYDYSDENIRSDDNENSGTKDTLSPDTGYVATKYEITEECLQGIVRDAAKFMVGRVDGSDNQLWPTYKENLVNTMFCYLRLLLDFATGDDSNINAPYGIRENKLTRWLQGKLQDGYEELEKEYFVPEYIDEAHIEASKIVFRDFVSQLRFMSKGKTEKYYEQREIAPDKRETANWNDVDYVVCADELEYALGVLFDTKYYNPAVMKNVPDINKSEGAYKFTFFDIHSDMYLFNGMSGFTEDNRKRRHDRTKGNIGKMYIDNKSKCKVDGKSERDVSIDAIKAVSEAVGESYDEIERRLTALGYQTT